MKINTSTLSMDASTGFREMNRLTAVVSTQRGGPGQQEQFRLAIPELEAGVFRSSGIVEKQESRATALVTGTFGKQTAMQATREQTIGRLVEETLGGKVTIREFTPATASGEVTGGAAEGRVGARSTALSSLTLGLQQVQYRKETIALSTAGTVTTADGRTISMQMSLSLERTEVQRQAVWAGLVSSRFIDPLVLTFEDGLATLSEGRFSFDLDGDGQDERIAGLTSGSGFLVLDRNGDGRVNNGLELFGPRLGTGYGELEIFDSDGNNWIDEGDPIFDSLQVWFGAGGDKERLVSLREAGVGAISLASVAAHFNLKDNSGRITGQVARSGLFLTEEGEPRSLAELELLSGGEERGIEALSAGAQDALLRLQNMLRTRRERMAALARLRVVPDRTTKEEDWLLRRLWQLQEEKSVLPG